MSEQEKNESQKTIVAFVAGLLIGGLLVFVFSGSKDSTDPVPTNNEESEVSELDNGFEEEEEADNLTNPTTSVDETVEETPTMSVGNGSVQVSDQSAGSMVVLDGVVFPVDEGWIAVRTYTNGQLGNILGAARFSNEQGLIPEAVRLLSPTVAGREYAVVFFTEDGDRQFNLATDVQIGDVFGTFTAQ